MSKKLEKKFVPGDFVNIVVGGNPDSRSNIWVVIGVKDMIAPPKKHIEVCELMLIRGKIKYFPPNSKKKCEILGPGYIKDLVKSSSLGKANCVLVEGVSLSQIENIEDGLKNIELFTRNSLSILENLSSRIGR